MYRSTRNGISSEAPAGSYGSSLDDGQNMTEAGRDPYRIVVESLNEGAVITAPDGTILFASPRFAELAGSDPTALIGAPFELSVRPEDRGLSRALLHDGLTDRTRCAVRLGSEDREPVPVCLSAGPCAPGASAGVSIVVTEPSRQGQTADLLEDLHLVRAALDLAADPIVVLAPDGRVRQANRAARELAGRDPVRLHLEEAFPLDSTSCPGPAGDSALPRNGPFDGLLASIAAGEGLRYRTSDGRGRTLRMEAAPVKADDGSTGYMAIRLIDDSARELEEHRLRQALEDAANAHRDLQQFAYAASHDLQEPIRMVASYLQLLQRRYRDRLDDDAQEFIGFAVDGANRMQQQINGLLRYSRVTSRGKPPRRVEAGEALAEALARLRQRLADTGAEITTGPLPAVMADPVQLAEVFENLIDNALTFRSESSPRIRVEGIREGDMVRFSVRDNGIGIDPEFHDRIFQMFQRLHAREAYPGMGIGLAVVQRIVDRHGGRCWVESAGGEGSTFFFTIPFAPVEVEGS